MDSAHPFNDEQGGHKTFGSNTAFERPAQPVELAPLYVFLASQEASYVTGEIYAATGGKTPF